MPTASTTPMAKKSPKRGRRKATRPDALEAITAKLPLWLIWEVDDFARLHALDQTGAIRYLLATRLTQMKQEAAQNASHGGHAGTTPLQIINHSPMGGQAQQRTS
jgi:hypothetical protein